MDWNNARLSGLVLTIVALAAQLSCSPSPRKLAQDLDRSILTVLTFDAEDNPLGQGTAFFIAPDAVITNVHVLKWAKSITLKSPARGVAFEVASVVGVNFDRDLCVIRTTAKEGRPLKFAKKGSVSVGDKIYVAGNPKGFEGTISAGIVSAIRDGGAVIQIDAPISPGSSGGPVVNERGEVVGIATASLVQGQNLNFAVGLLGGPDVREIDWPIMRIGYMAPSSLEYDFIKGPVKQVRETTSVDQRPPYSLRVKDFNENGMSLRSESMNKDDGGNWKTSLLFKTEYYDSRVVSRHDDNGEVTSYEYGEYEDADGRELETSFRTPEGFEFRWDAFGRDVEDCSPEGDRTYYRYGDGGLLLEKRDLASDGRKSTTTYSYTLDAFGNWVEKRESGRFGRVFTREIEYFETSGPQFEPRKPRR